MIKCRRWMNRLAALAAAVILAVTAAAAAGTDVSAAESTGSITITNPQDVTYTIYKIFDATVSSDGESVPYTATSEQVTFYQGQTGNPFTFTANTAGSYNVSVSDETADKTVTSFLISVYEAAAATDGVLTEITSDSYTKTTSSDGSVTYSGLPYGYYFIATSAGGAVVAIDNVTPEATIEDKANYGTPTVEKQVSTSLNGTYYDSIETSAGATVYYKATVTATKGAHGYVLHDRMSSSLTFKGIISVYVDGEEITDYTLLTGSNMTDSTCTFELEIPDDAIADFTGGEEIVVYYYATVSSSASSGTSFPNKVWLQYDDPYYWEMEGKEEEKTTDPDTATVKIPSSSTTTTTTTTTTDDDDDDDDTTTTTTTVESEAEEAASVLDAVRELIAGDEEGGSVLSAERLPQTGQLNWPIPVMAALGMLLIVLGYAMNRKGRRIEG